MVTFKMLNRKMFSWVAFMLFVNTLFANMANPWIYGSQTSTFISTQNMDVKHESINIHLHDGLKRATYHVTYDIISDSATTVPLLFIAENYDDDFFVQVNDKMIHADIAKKIPQANVSKFFSYIKSENEHEVYVLFGATDSLLVKMDDIIQFDAVLKKGMNKIEVTYEARNSFNRSNWFVEPEITYSLYPSRFWHSFKDISLNISADEKFKIVTSNVGMPIHPAKNEYNTSFSWQFKNIPADIIRIKVSPNISIVSKVLIYLEPVGIAFFVALLFSILHFIRISIRNKKQETGFNKPFWIGNFIVPIIFIVIFLFSFSLIDSSLGNHAGHFHGYTILVIVLLPFLWIIYTLIVWIICKIIFRK
jgi:hypothetical protein